MRAISESLFKDDFSPKAVIDLGQIYKNALEIKNSARGAAFCAVVKSDAYGHGACEVARKIQAVADCFAVATVREGRALRLAGIEKPVICLLPVQELDLAVFYDLQITISSHGDFENLCRFFEKNRTAPKVHFAVNTGMNRLGYDDFSLFCSDVYSAFISGISVVGVFSHFYDSADYRCDLNQYERFKPFSGVVKKYYPNALSHICSSGGLSFGEFNADMVRVGLLIYGYKPVNATLDVSPAMRVFAKRIACRNITSSDFVLYGNKPCEKNGSVSVVQYGYADGFSYIGGGLKNNCMNLSAVWGSDECYEVVPDFKSCECVGIYQRLVRTGAIKDKVYLD